MANEITVALLPCGSIDKIAEFYTVLGFTRIYYQVRPNPYVSLKREDLQLDFFGMPDFNPEDSYGTCLVIVPDTEALFEAFAAGMREAYGKLLVSGIPRMTRPRKRKNVENHSGFTLIDPGGNWIRIMAATPAPEVTKAASGRLTTSLDRAVVMGDSHGKHVRAAEILDAALERDKDTATSAELLEALAYRAELALRADDRAAAPQHPDRLYTTITSIKPSPPPHVDSGHSPMTKDPRMPLIDVVVTALKLDLERHNKDRDLRSRCVSSGTPSSRSAWRSIRKSRRSRHLPAQLTRCGLNVAQPELIKATTVRGPGACPGAGSWGCTQKTRQRDGGERSPRAHLS